MLCQSSSAEILEASFEIVHMIAKEKKPYNIGETLIKSCMLKAAGFALGKTCSKKMKISLSDSMIKTPNDELAKDMENQVPQKLLVSLFCSIQCNKTTNIVQMLQLLVNVCFNWR